MHEIIDLDRLQANGFAQIHPVILSGGSGTRLWPLSRASLPKQFLSLVSEKTLFQETVIRNLTDSDRRADRGVQRRSSLCDFRTAQPNWR